jgi:tetratricopeptide (TPR) repeat protein
MAEPDPTREELAQAARDLERAGDRGPRALQLNALLLRLDPRDEWAALRLGRCHLEAGEHEAAVEVWQRHVDSCSRSPVRSHLDGLRRKLQGEARVEAILEKEGFDVLWRWAHALKSMGRGSHFFVPAFELLARERRDPSTLAALASAYRAVNRLDEAEGVVAESLVLDDGKGSNPAAWTVRAAILRERGKLQLSRRLYEELERLHPDDHYLLEGLAAVYADLERQGAELGLKDRVSEMRRKAWAKRQRLRELGWAA